MDSGKSSRLVTTLSNRTFMLQGGLLEEEWGSSGQRLSRTIAGGQDFIPGAGARFDLVGTLQTVVVRETRETTRTMCWSCSSPAWCTSIRVTATLLNMSDCLSLQSSHSMSCCIWWLGLEDAEYGYVIMMIIVLLYLWHRLLCWCSTWLYMLWFIGANLISSLIKMVKIIKIRINC
jgi:hypothetical protein